MSTHSISYLRVKPFRLIRILNPNISYLGELPTTITRRCQFSGFDYYDELSRSNILCGKNCLERNHHTNTQGEYSSSDHFRGIPSYVTTYIRVI